MPPATATGFEDTSASTTFAAADLNEGEAKIELFLSDLAVNGHVAASTQNQAFNALLFLYREVLHQELQDIQAVRADRPIGVPVVQTPQEAKHANNRALEIRTAAQRAQKSFAKWKSFETCFKNQTSLAAPFSPASTRFVRPGHDLSTHIS